MEPMELAEQYLNTTGMSVFLTGKAGTGKTTFLHRFVRTTSKRCVVLAPTGVAAINAGGVTIHSFFLLPLCPYLPEVKDLVTEYQMPNKTKHLSKDKLRLIRMIDLLVIDEISMVRADLLDAVDATLRRVRRNSRPFGGVQLLMVGDLMQLPPVVTDDEKPFMDMVYPSPFFFHSKALQRMDYATIELHSIFRQQDSHFVDLLNNIRENRLDANTLRTLNSRYQPSFDPPDNEGYIRLTTHNHQADSVNNRKLAALPGRAIRLTATVAGNFPATSYPTAEQLVLKKGTQVMFVKNDNAGKWYNGKIATVEGYDPDEGVKVVDKEGNRLAVGRERWENIKYETSENGIKQSVEGTFEQYPLKLAWAITIHKSQGLTFDHVVIDAANAFTFGQVYVALSRCRSLEGIVLASPLSANCAFDNDDLLDFNKSIPNVGLLNQKLQQCQAEYYLRLLLELFDCTAIQLSAEELNGTYQQHLRKLFPKGADKMSELCSHAVADLADVGERFRKQLAAIFAQNGNSQNDSHLNDRIAKGQAYFSEQLEQIYLSAAPLMEATVDNKVVAKELATRTEAFRDAMTLKQRLLNRVAAEGFSTTAYNNAKSDFLYEKERNAYTPAKKTPVRNRRKTSVTSTRNIADTADYTDMKHPLLAARLTAWRLAESKRIGKPAYFVLTQRTLIAIANALPLSPRQLKALPGIGNIKYAQYGEAILDIVGAYAKETVEHPFS